MLASSARSVGTNDSEPFILAHQPPILHLVFLQSCQACLQLISQNFRGWAWTRALLGLPAKEIHLCGAQSAINVVQSLCKLAGIPEPTVHRFERLTPLEIDSVGLKNGSYLDVQPGDAVIGFSIRELFNIKSQIDRLTPYKAALIYGSLPSMARRQQASWFNTPGSGYEVRS
jgi:ATP-dependent RNA helicase SUPV3L1/SUV3